MSKKTLLIGVAVVGGGYVLYKLFSSSSAPARSTVSPNAGGSIISGLINAIPQAIASLMPPSGPNAYGSPGQAGYVAPNPYTFQGIDPTTGHTYDTQGIDPTTGGVSLAPGETYGPPAPVSSDNGLVSPDVVYA